MEVISLNVNNFGGLIRKPLIKDYTFDGQTKWVDWKNAVIEWRNKVQWQTNIDAIVDYVKNSEIVILQEVDTNSKAFEYFIRQMNEHSIIYPNKENESTFKKGCKSITVMFIKEGYNYTVPEVNFSSKAMRNVEVIIDNKHIIGLHISMGDIAYWDSLIKYYSSLERANVLFIGDFNVYDWGTKHKEKFLELLNCGAIDAWVEKGNSMDRPTANTGKRIDYAIMSPRFYDEFSQITIDDTLRNKAITDHSALRIVI